MKIYNTLSRKIEEFVPMSGKRVNLFVCGPTVYDFAHIGNAKTYTQFDFIVRYLRFLGYGVFYLQNITDIDDKIIKRSVEKGMSWKDLSGEYERIYLEDMKSLHNVSVTKYARATDYIAQIVKQVQTLVSKGYGYKTSDGIYFDIKKFADYGKLARRTEADQDAGVSRIDESFDKKNKNDFCLWRFSKPGEPIWETEIGSGRPGWHIEDTAITEKFFGPQYDVHGAAIDLIFPHHEAEIAQMEAASGKVPLVRYWMHTAFLNMSSEKMSKSKGNIISAREATAKYGYRVLRYLFVSAHYRTALDFNDQAIEQAKGALQRTDDFILSIDRDLDDAANGKFVGEFRNRIVAQLDNDFDTPGAMATMFDFIREQNSRGKAGKRVLTLFEELNSLFDFMNFRVEEVSTEISKLISQREQLRREKKFDEADLVRKEIEKLGFVLEDASGGVKIKKA